MQLLTAAFKVSKQQHGPLLVAFKPKLAAIAAALSCAVTGPFKNKEQHTQAVKSACSCAEGFRKLNPDKRLAQIVGGDTLNAVAKGIVTVRMLDMPKQTETQLQRLIGILGIQELVSKSKPDGATLAQLKKSKDNKQQLSRPTAALPKKHKITKDSAEGSGSAAKKQKLDKLVPAAAAGGSADKPNAGVKSQQQPHPKQQKQGKPQKQGVKVPKQPKSRSDTTEGDKAAKRKQVAESAGSGDKPRLKKPKQRLEQ